MNICEKNNTETRTIFAGNIVRHSVYSQTNFIQFGDLHNSDNVLQNGMFIIIILL